MDGETQIHTNSTESTTAVENHDEKVENKESSNQNNIIDVIGNGQLVKKVHTFRIIFDPFLLILLQFTF